MWELIARNKKKSLILFIVMGFILLILGYFIGYYIYGIEGAVYGTSIAFAIWLSSSAVSFFSGSSIILGLSGAVKATRENYPMLFNVVEEMKIASGLPAMPDIYILPENSPNAFATGRDPQHSSIAVTAGLLTMLNRDELQGVIAHEMSHILNRDILFMTFSGIMLGSIIFLNYFFTRYLIFGGRSNKKFNSFPSNRITSFLYIAGLIFIVLSPLIARFLYFAISRRREFLADATAVRLTRYPLGLASALQRISTTDIPMRNLNRVNAAFFISDPYKIKKMSFFSLSSHPPIEARINVLKSLSSGVSYLDYQNAYSKAVNYRHSNIIPLGELKNFENVSVIKKDPLPAEEQTKQQKHLNDITSNDLIRALYNFSFINCSCGMKFKVPENYPKDSIICPSCGRTHSIPGSSKEEKSPQKNDTDNPQLDKIVEDGKEVFVYQRKNKNGWESFSCPCGSPKQLSPYFKQKYFLCSKCGRKIKIS